MIRETPASRSGVSSCNKAEFFIIAEMFADHQMLWKGIEICLNSDFGIGRGIFDKGGALVEELKSRDLVGDLGIAGGDVLVSLPDQVC